ncbi:hypothetical protein KQX54_002395 [Cotesia glomerata]|uniref:Uncharacterized protein n=1 Tax=Cotesia glomerata TaxID=32391 RepID=A0AAV7II92_COTGL|nr:hypothetical protein KQX54_002395 [Cotesia glomerata]
MRRLAKISIGRFEIRSPLSEATHHPRGEGECMNESTLPQFVGVGSLVGWLVGGSDEWRQGVRSSRSTRPRMGFIHFRTEILSRKTTMDVTKLRGWGLILVILRNDFQGGWEGFRGGAGFNDTEKANRLAKSGNCICPTKPSKYVLLTELSSKQLGPHVNTPKINAWAERVAWRNSLSGRLLMEFTVLERPPTFVVVFVNFNADYVVKSPTGFGLTEFRRQELTFLHQNS